MPTTWVNDVKNLLSYYLGTQNDKYIVTQDGLLLWITDHEYNPLEKFASIWTSLTKN